LSLSTMLSTPLTTETDGDLVQGDDPLAASPSAIIHDWARVYDQKNWIPARA